ncbi:MAG: hypothetical protein M3Y43_03965 [Pseudomonadota bacterium]|nr:hypothetical protein [Pseudomonadota bacterium]MDQ2704297.1 hypothetical protein [Pseudomonadota bacterium]
MKTLKAYLALGMLGASLLSLAPASADPLMGSRGWQPRQESSRASIAALMMQKEQADNQAPSYAGAVFTCGGGSGTSTSTATANNNCTIVVDSHGNIIDADQISDGDQTADSDTTTTANGLTEESMSDILETLQ